MGMLSPVPAANSWTWTSHPFIQPWLQAERTGAGRGTWASGPCPLHPSLAGGSLRLSQLWRRLLSDTTEERERPQGALWGLCPRTGGDRQSGNWEEIMQLPLWCKAPERSHGNANPAQQTSASFIWFGRFPRITASQASSFISDSRPRPTARGSGVCPQSRASASAHVPFAAFQKSPIKTRKVTFTANWVLIKRFVCDCENVGQNI